MTTRRKKHRWDSTPIASRAWTREERRVVLRGFFGRFTIAIEPFLVGLFLAFLPIGMWLGHQEAALMVAPIFDLLDGAEHTRRFRNVHADLHRRRIRTIS
jgi:hypothetical protein